MVADLERDTLERVGRQLALRLGDLRAALRNASRSSSDERTRQLARAALEHDDDLEAGIDYRPPAPAPSRVQCVRCRMRDRSAGSLWCWACEPSRPTAAAGHD